MPEQVQNPALDPTALAKAYADIAQRSSELMTEYMKRQKSSAASNFGDELGMILQLGLSPNILVS